MMYKKFCAAHWGARDPANNGIEPETELRVKSTCDLCSAEAVRASGEDVVHGAGTVEVKRPSKRP